jgi:hypothetical protein
MSERVRYLAATLALAAIVMGYFLLLREPAKAGPRPGTRPAEARLVAPLPHPTARMLLDRTTDLALTQGQHARLEALDRQWKMESVGLETAVRQEQEAFSQFMQEAQARGKASVQEIQRRSADLREVSETLRERRQQHAEAALEVLTESQRQMLSTSAASARHGGA